MTDPKHNPQFLSIVNDAKKRIHEISLQELVQKQREAGRFHLVDVREESEWDQEHVPGATHMSKGVIERDIENQIPDRNAEIILYCGGGFRSALAADNLQRMGYANVKSMAGGFRGWKEAGLPTTL